MRVSESLEIVEAGGKRQFGCAKCGYVLCSVTENFKTYALKYDSPQSKAEPSYLTPSDLFVLREYYCPKCGVLFEVDLLPKGESDIPTVLLI